jgi:hypothetical protein
MTENVVKPAVAAEATVVPAEHAAEPDPFEGIQSESFNAGEPIPEETPGLTLVPDVAVEEPEVAPEPEPAPAPEPSKPKQTAQERINELTRLRREAERKAEALEARIQEMERPPEPEPEPKVEKPEGPPDPSTFDYGELDPRYITALVGYQTDQGIAAFRAEEAQKAEQTAAAREHQEVQERFQKQIESGSEKHADFQEKVMEGAEKGEWSLGPDMAKMLADSDVGDDIAYHLATNPDESHDVYRQSPVEQARYFGKMEAKFSADQSAAPGKTEAKPPKAPPPVMPARGADGKFQPSADSEDFRAFEKVVNSQE